ncbi:Sas10/Utp3/C1D [Corchorus capsularis]|uniref:Sas10/Utp3/C1D n=1 Tax=Corchorus capsularis TaxID=210143 RepID=A0A1R3FY84_COCAP|nr:Sas10/Utp3/C1D [Corchorus capsularis]
MEEINKANENERLKKEANQLAAVLKEMKSGLDAVTAKVQALTAKVKANNLPTADGISYLEAKHLLLLNYCQSLVYYLLRKAKGLSIEGHPVVRSLVEIRLFLEKIRPIDKKLQYQIQKLTRASGSATQQVSSNDKSDDPQKNEDPLNYRPNPDMLISKADMMPEDGTGVYRPPKFAPAVVEEDHRMSRQEKNALRREKEALRRASQSAYIRDMMDDLEGKPEEVREIIGAESRELSRYMAKLERRAQQEEELFTRAPVTKKDKKIEKHLKKSRNGLLGLTDSFFDEIKTLPLGDDAGEKPTSFSNGNSGMGKHKKRKVRG